jgi:hypothetical protein
MKLADYRITDPTLRGVEWNRWQIRMAPMLIRLKIALAAVVLSTAIVSGQQAVRPGTAGKAVRPAGTAAREIRSLINGVAVDSDRLPLANATIRLRNLQVNAIEQTVTTNALGEFSFVALPGVPYVVEITDQEGRVIAVGDVVLANPGEVAGAVLALPSNLPVLATVFSDTASLVVAAATNSGLTIVDPVLPKLSPTR